MEQCFDRRRGSRMTVRQYIKMLKNYSINKSIFLTILNTFISCSNILANIPTSISGYNQKWINLGFGGFKGNEFLGIGGVISLNYYINKYLISLRVINANDVSYSLDINNNENSIKNLNDIGVTLGLIKKNKYVYTSISSGIGLINDNDRLCIKGQHFTTFGIPLEVQLFLTPLAALGLGVNVVGNINNKSSYFGLLFCIQYGILR